MVTWPGDCHQPAADDIHATGRTLVPDRQLVGCQLMVWINKAGGGGLWAAAEICATEWI